MIFPAKLQPGDTVALIAPSSPLLPGHQTSDSISAIQSLGYRVWEGESLYSSTPCGYAAAPAEVRARDINRAFADPDVKAIWCIRGGNASAQLMSRLDYDLIAANPKIFIGYSDITNLLVAFQQRCGFVTYHGPTANDDLVRDFDSYTCQSLFAALNMEEELRFANPEGDPILTMHSGCAEGILTGGNLELIASMIGTPYQIDAHGRILFLEEVRVPVYRIDRLLHQLLYAGVLDDAAGIILGDYTDCGNHYNESYGPLDLLRDFFKDYKKPVLYNVRAGHGRLKGTLPLGAMCGIDGRTAQIILRKANDTAI